MQDSTQLFYQAVTLMLVGMGFVFGFLSLLIGVIKTLISPLASRFPDAESPTRQDQLSSSVENDPPKPIIAAISIAVHQYRQKHKK